MSRTNELLVALMIVAAAGESRSQAPSAPTPVAEVDAEDLRALLERVATATFTATMTTEGWAIPVDADSYFDFAAKWSAGDRREQTITWSEGRFAGHGVDRNSAWQRSVALLTSENLCLSIDFTDRSASLLPKYSGAGMLLWPQHLAGIGGRTPLIFDWMRKEPRVSFADGRGKVELAGDLLRHDIEFSGSGSDTRIELIRRTNLTGTRVYEIRCLAWQRLEGVGLLPERAEITYNWVRADNSEYALTQRVRVRWESEVRIDGAAVLRALPQCVEYIGYLGGNSMSPTRFRRELFGHARFVGSKIGRPVRIGPASAEPASAPALLSVEPIVAPRWPRLTHEGVLQAGGLLDMRRDYCCQASLLMASFFDRDSAVDHDALFTAYPQPDMSLQSAGEMLAAAGMPMTPVSGEDLDWQELTAPVLSFRPGAEGTPGHMEVVMPGLTDKGLLVWSGINELRYESVDALAGRVTFVDAAVAGACRATHVPTWLLAVGVLGVIVAGTWRRCRVAVGGAIAGALLLVGAACDGPADAGAGNAGEGDRRRPTFATPESRYRVEIPRLGEVRVLKVPVFNTTDAPLELEVPIPNCACISTEQGRLRLPPRGHVDVEVVVRPKSVADAPQRLMIVDPATGEALVVSILIAVGANTRFLPDQANVTYQVGDGIVDKVCTVEVKRPRSARQDLKLRLAAGAEYAEPVVMLCQTLPMRNPEFVRDVYGIALAMNDENLRRDQLRFARLELVASQAQAEAPGGPASIGVNVMVNFEGRCVPSDTPAERR